MHEPSRDAAIAEAARRLAAIGVPDAARDARLIARWATGHDAAGLVAAGDGAMTAEEARRFQAAVAARCARQPMAQIIGQREFWGRSFRVTPDVLDPRPETETLIAAALGCRVALPKAARVIDLGTGTGCILLTLLSEWQQATGLGTDLSPAALAVARANAEAHGLQRRAAFAEGSWWDGVSGEADLVVSNPPYVTAAEWAGLAPEVRLHEPRTALVPDPDPERDGLAAYRTILDGAPSRLRPGGCVLVETGAGQAKAVASLATRAGLHDVATHRDLDGRERVVSARASGGPRPAL
ncbi:MAG: peptide chain release factor N(5)-glutamine methyltransferase [Pseudomonadota bacterium]